MTEQLNEKFFTTSKLTGFLGKKILKPLYDSLNNPQESQSRILLSEIEYLRGTELFNELNFDKIITEGSIDELFQSFRENVPLTSIITFQEYVKRTLLNEQYMFPSHDPVCVAGMTSGTTGPPKIFPISEKGLSYIKSAMKLVYGLPIQYAGINALRKKTFLLRPAPIFSNLEDVIDFSTLRAKYGDFYGKSLEKIPVGYMTAIVGAYPKPSDKFYPSVKDIEIFPNSFIKIMIYFTASFLKYRRDIFSMLGVTSLYKIIIENIINHEKDVLLALNILNNREILLEDLKKEIGETKFSQIYKQKDLLVEQLEKKWMELKDSNSVLKVKDYDKKLLSILKSKDTSKLFPYLKTTIFAGAPFDESSRRFFEKALGENVLLLDQLGGTDSVVGFQLASKTKNGWKLDNDLTPITNYSVLEFLKLSDLYKVIGEENTHYGISKEQMNEAFKECGEKTKFIWELEPNTQYLFFSTIPYWPLVRYSPGDVIRTTNEKVGKGIYKMVFEKRIEGGFNYFGSKITDNELITSLSKAAQSTGAEVVHFTVNPDFTNESSDIKLKIFIEFVEPPNNTSIFTQKFKEFLSKTNKIFAVIQDRFDISISVVKKDGFIEWTTEKGTNFPGHAKVPTITNDVELLSKFLTDDPTYKEEKS